MFGLKRSGRGLDESRMIDMLSGVLRNLKRLSGKQWEGARLSKEVMVGLMCSVERCDCCGSAGRRNLSPRVGATVNDGIDDGTAPAKRIRRVEKIIAWCNSYSRKVLSLDNLFIYQLGASTKVERTILKMLSNHGHSK
jgi:hypothetical protein